NSHSGSYPHRTVHPHWHIAASGCAVTEASAVVDTPAVRHASGSEPARVVQIGADAAEDEPARDRNGREAGSSRAVAQLAACVEAPAVRGASGSHATALARAGEYRRKARPTHRN